MNEHKKTKNEPDSRESQKSKIHAALIGFTLISLLIAIIALIFAFISYKQLPEHKAQLANIRKANQAFLNTLEQKEVFFQNEISAKLAKNEASVNQLLQQSTNIPAKAAFLEATYLTHLAQLSIKFSSDPKNAKTMLHLALQRIENYNTPKIYNLRNQINTLLNALNQTPDINTQSLLTSIDNLIASIKNISVLPKTKMPIDAQNKKPTPSPQNWWDKMKHNLGKIKSFFVIQKIEDPNEYAFNPEKKIITKQLIIIKLTQAQWALITRDQAVFKQSLQSALKMLPTLNIEKSTEDFLTQQINNLLAVSSPQKQHMTSNPAQPTLNNFEKTQNNEGDK